ncbi:MAG: glycoside hydrolase family 57 protein [Acidobacteria bacterium]|nr:glycoside hydrolase family 57 protein [Acidobacteriota bacterium]
MKQSYLMLLWHMHQPFYKDLSEGVYAMPWVRLHALKDYFGMVALLREFPSFHATFNLVPSLVSQLQEYARDEAREQAYELAFKPAASLSGEERERLVHFSFQVNVKNLVSRFPRFRELYDKVRSGDPKSPARFFVTQDLLDLQVLSQLAWFDEIYLSSDEVVRGLVRKGRGYSEGDKSEVRKKEIEIFNVTLEEYKKASERGQIEISTSPFYHPILPLLCDTNIALESHSGVRLPRRAFHRPEDALGQLHAAIELHQQVFGRRPNGLWPSEGSVSDEVLRLAAQAGFTWAATDEGVLSRSIQANFHRHPDGTVERGRELYRPHRLTTGNQQISLFFRDHYLSDLIGFVYSRMEPGAAAEDLYQRIRRVACSTGEQPALISIILDGENAWEFYPGNGREFLKAFYRRVAADPELKAVTASEALQVVEQGNLTHIVPGSWINANFDVWIGAEEDNRAWELLAEARDFFERSKRRANLDPASVRNAQHEVWVSEGSDWCWWYGPEHSSAHDEEFDFLYRKHLSNIYRLLGGSPPDDLAVPVKSAKLRAVNYLPTGYIEPEIDGLETNYFEWIGAGLYLPDISSGSMHGTRNYLEALYYGYSARALYLRLDFSPDFSKDHPSFEVRITINGDNRARLHAIAREGAIRQIEFWRGEELLLVPLATRDRLRASFSNIFEVEIAYDLLGIDTGGRLRLQASLWANDLPLQVMPLDGWLTIELTEEMSVW